MIWYEILLLVFVGLLSGFINTIAGGGSLITLPIMIFLGLPSTEANASNRLSIFFQNIFAVTGFKSKGVSVFPFAIWLAISACFGSVIGSFIALKIDGNLFNRILAIVMLIVMIMTFLKHYILKNKIDEIFNSRKNLLSIVIFFFIGIYGGFIQAGIGFLMIAALVGVHGLNMSKTNSIKVFVALTYTTISLIIFIYNDVIRWDYGLSIALGSALGGWISSRWSVNVNDKLIHIILMIMIFFMSVKLWFF